MHTVDCSIKEIDKLGLFNGNKALNIPAILRSIKNYEQKFYTANENYTKQVQYPLIKGLQKAVEQKTVYSKDGIKIDIWDINPYKYKKYIIFCEGISSEKSHPLQQNTYLKLINAGWGVLAFDYRGRGKSSGQFSQSGARIDVQTVYQYLLTGGIAPCNIGIIGHSMGSAIASDFSAKNNVAFTILINPFSKAADMVKNIAQKADMPDIMRKIISKIPAFLIPLQNKFDNEKAIKKINSPVYIIHSKDDDIIPVQLARKLASISIKTGNNIIYTELKSGAHDLNEEKTDFCLKFIKQSCLKNRYVCI